MRPGRSTETDEHVVGAETGCIKARAVKKGPNDLRRDKEGFEAAVYPTWSQDDLKEVRKAPDWAPTERRQTCEGEGLHFDE